MDLRAYGGFARLAWGYGIGCAVDGCSTRDCRPGGTHPIECAHVDRAGGGGGMGLKARYTSTIFLCWRHHDELDRVLGPRLFAEKYTLRVCGVYVSGVVEAARETERQWRLKEEGLAY